MKKIFVLFKVWYEGDSNMVDDSFVAASETKENLFKLIPPDAEAIFLPGSKVPDDGEYGCPDRYRIEEIELV